MSVLNRFFSKKGIDSIENVSVVDTQRVTTTYGQVNFSKYSNGIKVVEIVWNSASFPPHNSKIVLCNIPDGYAPLKTLYLFGISQNNKVIALECLTSKLSAYESTEGGLYLRAIYE